MTLAFEFHISIYDPDVAQRKGKPAEVGFSLRGMTKAQRTAGLAYMRRFLAKLEQHEREHPEEDDMGLTKHGSGEVLPEPDDQQKTAAANWTEKDDKELVEELQGDGKQ